MVLAEKNENCDRYAGAFIRPSWRQMEREVGFPSRRVSVQTREVEFRPSRMAGRKNHLPGSRIAFVLLAPLDT